MAKPQQKRKARPSWFQKQIERDGEEFLLRKQPLDIQREAFNIIRDITRGNITHRDMKYLFNLNILSNVKIAVHTKYVETLVYYASMSLSLQVPNGVHLLVNNYGIDDASFQKVYNDTQNTLTAYGAVLTALDSMIMTVQGTYPNDEVKNTVYNQVYSSVQYQLSRFKFII